MKRALSFLSVLLFAIVASCGEGTYTVTYRNPLKSSDIRYKTTQSSKPMQLLPATEFGDSESGRKLMMWSTRPDSTKRDNTPRSDSEIFNPESPDDLNFRPSSLYNGRKSLTLYAIWTEGLAGITYDANGGVFPDGTSQKSEDKKYGTVYLIPSEKAGSGSIIAGIRDKTGRTFLGWNTKKVSPEDVDTVDLDDLYIEGDRYAGNGALMLYAVWGTEHHNIKYVLNEESVAKRVAARNDNGFFNETASFAPGDKKLGFIMAGSESGTKLNGEPQMKGSRFVCWATDPDRDPEDLDSDGFYPANSMYVEIADITLYAIWKEHTYVITYVPDPDGFYDEAGISKNKEFNGYTDFASFKGARQIKHYYSPLSISAPPVESGNSPIPIPNCEGYEFRGWRRSEDLLFPANGVLTENNKFTLYGQWEEKEVTYTMNFVDGYKPVTYEEATSKNKVTKDLQCIFEDRGIAADSPYRARGVTSDAPASIVRRYLYWDQKPYRSERFVSTEDVTAISGYAQESEGFDFLGWTVVFGDNNDNENVSRNRIVSSTKIMLDTFSKSSADEPNSNQEILSYDKKIYSRWKEKQVNYRVGFSTGTRNSYINDNPLKSVISNMPSEFNLEYNYWEHLLFNKDVVTLTLTNLNRWIPACTGFTFDFWSLDYSDDDVAKKVDSATGIKLSHFTQNTENVDYSTGIFARWAEDEVEYKIKFSDGTTNRYNAFMSAEPDRVTSDLPDDVVYSVKYWDSYRAWDPDVESDDVRPIKVGGLEDLTKPTYEPFETYWSLSDSADGNEVTSDTELPLTDFAEDVANDEYSITLYGHWGKPVIGKTMSFGHHNWIIIGSNETDQQVKLFLNDATANSAKYSSDDLCDVNTCDGNHWQIQDWKRSSIRNFINSTEDTGFCSTFSEEMKNARIGNQTTTGGKYPSITGADDDDYLWLPSAIEMEGLAAMLDETNANYSKTFSDNVAKWDSMMWQRDNNSTTKQTGISIAKDIYSYTLCALNSTGVTKNHVETSTDIGVTDSSSKHSYRPMGWFSYALADEE
ncbi:MAG TPA: hypothetical protein DCO86_00555 [Spirochaetaceae bacterium]|nr:hypothetical protein [Spirochaetaceae bacterium]